MEHGNPDEIHDNHGIQTAKNGDVSAGKGGWKKRMPFCNRTDREDTHSEKEADFHLVSTKMKFLEKT